MSPNESGELRCFLCRDGPSLYGRESVVVMAFAPTKEIAREQLDALFARYSYTDITLTEVPIEPGPVVVSDGLVLGLTNERA